MLILETSHVRIVHPRDIISRLRLVHAYNAIVLALKVDRDKLAASVRWGALSPLSRALPSRHL